MISGRTKAALASAVPEAPSWAAVAKLKLDVAAKLERRLIAERTARGRADAKVKGGNSGASRSPSSSKKHGRELQQENHSAAS